MSVKETSITEAPMNGRKAGTSREDRNVSTDKPKL